MSNASFFRENRVQDTSRLKEGRPAVMPTSSVLRAECVAPPTPAGPPPAPAAPPGAPSRNERRANIPPTKPAFQWRPEASTGGCFWRSAVRRTFVRTRHDLNQHQHVQGCPNLRSVEAPTPDPSEEAEGRRRQRPPAPSWAARGSSSAGHADCTFGRWRPPSWAFVHTTQATPRYPDNRQ